MSEDSKTEPNLEPEKFFPAHHDWQKAEEAAASDAGERRQAIGALADDLGMSNKAMSHLRQVLKFKKDGQKWDWVRTMEDALPKLRAYLQRNSWPDMMDQQEEQADAQAAMSKPIPFNEDAA